METKNTLIVNLFGAPGSGKSTSAAWLYWKLKCDGYNVELVREYAKYLTYEGSIDLVSQWHVFGCQKALTITPFGKVDCIITDSPIMLSPIYDKDKDARLLEAAKKFHFAHPTLNYYLHVRRGYKQEGRRETLVEASKIAKKILRMLLQNKIEYTTICDDISKSGIEKEIESRIDAIKRDVEVTK